MVIRTQLVRLEDVRPALAKLWLLGFALPFGILISQTVAGHYGEDAGLAWKWFLPSMIPILTEILGVLGYTALERKQSRIMVRRLFFQIAYSLSFVYLLLVFVTIAIEPFVEANALQLMEASKNWLYPLQGLTAAAIGVLFFKRVPS